MECDGFASYPAVEMKGRSAPFGFVVAFRILSTEGIFQPSILFRSFQRMSLKQLSSEKKFICNTIPPIYSIKIPPVSSKLGDGGSYSEKLSQVEWTYPTYTTFEIPPLPPVYVISCNSSLLPEPPLGSSWNCTKAGEGQECRAVSGSMP